MRSCFSFCSDFALFSDHGSKRPSSSGVWFGGTDRRMNSGVWLFQHQSSGVFWILWTEFTRSQLQTFNEKNFCSGSVLQKPTGSFSFSKRVLGSIWAQTETVSAAPPSRRSGKNQYWVWFPHSCSFSGSSSLERNDWGVRGQLQLYF